jgi:hypothetical protein
VKRRIVRARGLKLAADAQTVRRRHGGTLASKVFISFAIRMITSDKPYACGRLSGSGEGRDHARKVEVRDGVGGP